MMLENLKNLDVTLTGGKVSKVDPSSIPGFIPSSKTAAWDASKYRVRYKRFDLQDPADIIDLELIETKAIRDQGVYILSKERFVFMDKILMLIQYLEKIPD